MKKICNLCKNVLKDKNKGPYIYLKSFCELVVFTTAKSVIFESFGIQYSTYA